MEMSKNKSRKMVAAFSMLSSQPEKSGWLVHWWYQRHPPGYAGGIKMAFSEE